jgi:protein-S-isoprenylcysteine O-methyltransferase Ste14
MRIPYSRRTDLILIKPGRKVQMVERLPEQRYPVEDAIDLEVETRRGVIRWLVRETVGVVMVGGILFLAAGTWRWPMAWLLVGIYALWVAVQAVAIIPKNPGLLVERTRRGRELNWDTKLMSIIGLLTLTKYIVAGLDYRFGWSPEIPSTLQVIAALLAAAGYALGAWAMISNAYFSMTYRIQEDRGHAVASAGPYGVIRHPAYLGTIIFELSTPILLGSLWALIPGAMAAGLFVLRTKWEDRALQTELVGYADYARRVEHRLLPGIW